jgi:hypothetical protein
MREDYVYIQPNPERRTMHSGTAGTQEWNIPGALWRFVRGEIVRDTWYTGRV